MERKLLLHQVLHCPTLLPRHTFTLLLYNSKQAVVLVVPKLQTVVISVFTNTDDSVLMAHCRHLLLILAVLLLFDMAQMGRC